MKEISGKFDEALTSLSQLIAKLQVVGNDEILKRFIDFYNYSRTPTADTNVIVNKQVDLTQAIRKDLMGEKNIDWLTSIIEKNKEAKH